MFAEHGGDPVPVAGGVIAPRGFLAAGVYAGLKKRERLDLGLIYSQYPAAAAAVYTRNLVKAAPLQVTKEHLSGGLAQAVVVNSGNANACNGEQGLANARRMAQVAATELKIAEHLVVVASTGVIGVPLPIELVANGIKEAAARLSPAGGDAVAEAIMTTDLVPKVAAVQWREHGIPVSVGGIAKGSGMIHPNMATMLCFLTTDAAIAPDLLQETLTMVVNKTFNMISVDGDTSTNDMVVILANGAAGAQLVERGAGLQRFAAALEGVCRQLARAVASDGEGATKLIQVEVRGALIEEDARMIAKSIAASNLVKAAVFGEDANWGRILTAAGYSGASFDPVNVDIYLASAAGRECMARQGAGLIFDEERARGILQQPEVIIEVDLNQGKATATAWGCDLSYDYVKINAAYRT